MKIKRQIGFLALAGLGLMEFASPRADAATISFFANGSYVDMTREGPNLRATLVGLGHTVVDFTGITAADFAAATAGGQVLVFPEMEVGNLYDDLDGAATSVLSSFVSGGGGIIQANYYSSNSNLANGLLGYGLVQAGSIGATSLDVGAATGTPWASGPLTLPGSNAVEGVLSSSLPLGALNLYHSGLDTSVFATVFGSGTLVCTSDSTGTNSRPRRSGPS